MKTSTFKDHFSGHAGDYSAFRPGYPPGLFSELARLSPATDLAWDCATGSGQAARQLAPLFAAVIATDASAQQIDHAEPCPGVEYRVARAEHSELAGATVDLITVAQAIHWFDLDAFAAEVNRVLKPGGVLSAWTYGLLSISPDLDFELKTLYTDIVGPYWPFDRELVDGGYAILTLPFEPLPFAPLTMTEHWTFEQLIGYLNTWSAAKAFEKDRGVNPVDDVAATLEAAWGDLNSKQPVSWPLYVRVWRKA